MKAGISHIAVRFGLLVVMCASSLGVTTVLKYCTMSQSSECCCSDDFDTPKSRPAVPPLEYRNVFCNIQIVAGGVNPVALNVSAEASFKALTSDLLPVDSGIVPLPFVSHQRILTHANDIAPPGDDTCIRNCALLI
jgi:hypothetical protein